MEGRYCNRPDSTDQIISKFCGSCSFESGVLQKGNVENMQDSGPPGLELPTPALSTGNSETNGEATHEHSQYDITHIRNFIAAFICAKTNLYYCSLLSH